MIALQSLVALSCLLGMMFLYNDYRVDLLRQELFAVRDRLFDEARAGRISFASPGYQAARHMCNGLIRFGHQISLLEFLLFRYLAPRPSAAAVAGSFREFIGGLEPNERAIVEEYMAQANRCVVAHVIRSPFVLVTVLPPIACFVMAKAGFDVLAFGIKRLAEPLQSLDALAVNEGRRAVNSTFGSGSFAAR